MTVKTCHGLFQLIVERQISRRLTLSCDCVNIRPLTDQKIDHLHSNRTNIAGVRSTASPVKWGISVVVFVEEVGTTIDEKAYNVRISTLNGEVDRGKSLLANIVDGGTGFQQRIGHTHHTDTRSDVKRSESVADRLAGVVPLTDAQLNFILVALFDGKVERLFGIAVPRTGLRPPRRQVLCDRQMALRRGEV